MLLMSEQDLAGKRVLLREDLNVPLDGGRITDDTRIRAAVPAIKQALDAGAAVLVMSHLGRPVEGEFDPQFSLAPVAASLEAQLGIPVPLVADISGGVQVQAGEVVLLENVRFAKGEKKDDEALSKQLASLCDVFVHDAFATAHRAQASTHGVAKYAPVACAGPLLAGELQALSKAMKTPAKPMVAIVGGAKVSSKLLVLEQLLDKVDTLIVGGGIANTFLKAAGHKIGTSLCEDELVEAAARMLETAGERIPLPVDVVCAKEFAADAAATLRDIGELADDDMILDVGPRTITALSPIIRDAGTILWNGPLGVFEFDQFGSGTAHLSRAIAASKGFSIAGGGDTLAAIAKYEVSDDISYISTGGGAFLEYLEGKTLPAVEVLESRQ